MLMAMVRNGPNYSLTPYVYRPLAQLWPIYIVKKTGGVRGARQSHRFTGFERVRDRLPSGPASECTLDILSLARAFDILSAAVVLI